MKIRKWPTLQSKAKTGKIKYWEIEVVKNLEDSIFTRTIWWQDDGAHQVAAKRVEGKNIGRSNETTDLEQAFLEAESEFKKQKDKGYREEGEVIDSFPLPMLAQDFKKAGHRVKFPCFGQPKLDGIRALYNGNTWWSRKGKLFPEKCLKHLSFDTKWYTLDGELMLPEGYTFQQTCSAVKKFDPELSPKLEYHVFDLVFPGIAWFTRDSILFHELFAGKERKRQIVRVPNFKLENKQAAEEKMAELTEQGYEGLILRNEDGEYTINQRSADLQKFKEFIDEEFMIYDVVDGVGREEGAAIFVCVSPRHKAPTTFNVRPKGTYEQRQEWFKNKKDLIYKQLTVRYQNLSDDMIPRFPVGLSIRDYE